MVVWHRRQERTDRQPRCYGLRWSGNFLWTTVSRSTVMGQVQNGRLYIRYRSNFPETKQRSEKSLQTTSFCYSIAKSIRKTLLTFSKVEKTKHENFDFVHLLSLFFFFSIKHNSKTIRCMQILSIPNDCSANEDYSYLFGAVYELRLASYGLKTVSNTLRSPSYASYLFTQ